MDDVRWLEQWFSTQCRGDWANDQGVTIQSLDNPGWKVTVDLRGTDLEPWMADALLRREGEPPSAENGNVGGADWLECLVKDGRFIGAGDPGKLGAILRCFREWAGQ